MNDNPSRQEALRDMRLAVFEGVLQGSIFRDGRSLNATSPYKGEEHYSRSISAAVERIQYLLEEANAPVFVKKCFEDMNPSCFFDDPEGIEGKKGALQVFFWIENVLEWQRTS